MAIKIANIKALDINPGTVQLVSALLASIL